MADVFSLNVSQKSRYKSWYCGLCSELAGISGYRGRLTLNYDLTFLTILLSSVYELPEKAGAEKCFHHPIKPQSFTVTEATSYCAGLNILLAYWKMLDDKADDKSFVRGIEAGIFKKEAEKCRKMLSFFANEGEKALKELSELEKRGIMDPDAAAKAFGRLTRAMFMWKTDSLAPLLGDFGDALGRFIYIMDAALDMRSDIKKERYNPLVALGESDFRPYLTMLAGHVKTTFDKLPIKADREILENIIYSGMWLKYDLKNAKRQES